MDSETILKNHIHELEGKLTSMNHNYTKLNRKLIQVQNNYEKMDILYDKLYSILNEQQKIQLEGFIDDYDK